MDKYKLRDFQINAIKAISTALERRKKRIVVEVANGCGGSFILAKALENMAAMCAANGGKVIVVTNRLIIKENIQATIFNTYKDNPKIDPCSIRVETEQWLLRNEGLPLSEYQYVVFYNTVVSERIYNYLSCENKTVVIFSSKIAEELKKFFSTDDVVFTYSVKDAVNAGYLTPAMDTMAYGPAVEKFARMFLEQFGYSVIESSSKMNNGDWDLILQKSGKKLYVDCRTYKSQIVSPSTANSMLYSVVMRKRKVAPAELVVIIVLSRVPSFRKDEIYERYGIIVFDIDNLMFYIKGNDTLLNQLTQITYFPIDSIKSLPSKEAEFAGLSLVDPNKERFTEIANSEDETDDLICQLEKCEAGKEEYGKYEEICEKILRHLFEAKYFNKLIRQHNTDDAHFRMDLIGSLKISQSNDKSMHPLWQMLVQHYKSHFVVFEFKNYSEEISQNVIYITEKYLFDTALRNVAFVISPKGFSKSAKFAAEGSLKEHGKLILDINNNDLKNMLESKDGEAADKLLEKLEEFLMGISK